MTAGILPTWYLSNNEQSNDIDNKKQQKHANKNLLHE